MLSRSAWKGKPSGEDPAGWNYKMVQMEMSAEAEVAGQPVSVRRRRILDVFKQETLCFGGISCFFCSSEDGRNTFGRSLPGAAFDQGAGDEGRHLVQEIVRRDLDRETGGSLEKTDVQYGFLRSLLFPPGRKGAEIVSSCEQRGCGFHEFDIRSRRAVGCKSGCEYVIYF